MRDNLIRNLQAIANGELITSQMHQIADLFPKWEQIAIYTPHFDATKVLLQSFGCKTWVEDYVTAKGTVGPLSDKERILVAHLAFNYDLNIELELIQYHTTPNWHSYKQSCLKDRDVDSVFLSHISYHVPSIDQELEKYSPFFRQAGSAVVQRVTTIAHSNPKVGDRRYEYAILDTRASIGFDLKLIERILPTDAKYPR